MKEYVINYKQYVNSLAIIAILIKFDDNYSDIDKVKKN